MQNLIKQFTGKEHGALVQFIKYGIAGGLATGVHIVVVTIVAAFILPCLSAQDKAVEWLHLPSVDIDQASRALRATLGNFIAFLFSNFVAYFLNIKFVFEDGRHSRKVEMAAFFAVSGFSIAVGSCLVFVLVNKFGAETSVAILANVVASVMINYVMRKFVIFKG